MWHIAQLAMMGAVTALVLPVMPSHNAVAAGLVADSRRCSSAA